VAPATTALLAAPSGLRRLTAPPPRAMRQDAHRGIELAGTGLPVATTATR
jgi:hypothetical protein